MAGVILGGSWVVTSGVISPLIWVITTVALLIAPLRTTHEPPSNNLMSQNMEYNEHKHRPRNLRNHRDALALGFPGPYYWVLDGSRALTIRSVEA